MNYHTKNAVLAFYYKCDRLPLRLLKIQAFIWFNNDYIKFSICTVIFKVYSHILNFQ